MALSEFPVIVQPVAVPLVTEKVTAPVLEPPLVTKVRGAPTVRERLVIVRAAWAVPTARV